MDKRLKYLSANDECEIYSVEGRDDVIVARYGNTEWKPQRIDSRGRLLSGIYPCYKSSYSAATALFTGQWEKDRLEVVNEYRESRGMSLLQSL